MRQFTCPSGHKMSGDQFRFVVDMDVKEIDDAIVFACPVGKRGHSFTLRKAVASGMFSEAEAEKIRKQAGKALRDLISRLTIDCLQAG